MTVALIIILSLYCFLLLAFIIGLGRVRNAAPGDGKTKHGISVIIACRNEEHNIKDLVKSLAGLDYPHENFEVILVDDHSTDKTLDELKRHAPISNFRIMSLGQEQGKKKALKLGIDNAKFDVIATTDADCSVPVDWLSYISLYMENASTHLLIGAVAVTSRNYWFSKLQSMEFSAVMGATLAAVRLGHTIMCNGANLAFRKKTFYEVKGYDGNLHLASGDDEFLMRKIVKQYSDGVEIMGYSESVVKTPSEKSLKNFFYQRLRWASKWKHNVDVVTRLLAVFILISQAGFFVMAVWVVFYPVASVFVLEATGIILLKLLLEFIFVFRAMRFLHEKFNLAAFVFLEALYPMYVFTIGALSLVSSYRWKDRAFQ